MLLSCNHRHQMGSTFGCSCTGVALEQLANFHLKRNFCPARFAPSSLHFLKPSGKMCLLQRRNQEVLKTYLNFLSVDILEGRPYRAEHFLPLFPCHRFGKFLFQSYAERKEWLQNSRLNLANFLHVIKGYSVSCLEKHPWPLRSEIPS